MELIDGEEPSQPSFFTNVPVDSLTSE
jgi:hypothetical protein